MNSQVAGVRDSRKMSPKGSRWKCQLDVQIAIPLLRLLVVSMKKGKVDQNAVTSFCNNSLRKYSTSSRFWNRSLEANGWSRLFHFICAQFLVTFIIFDTTFNIYIYIAHFQKLSQNYLLVKTEWMFECLNLCLQLYYVLFYKKALGFTWGWLFLPLFYFLKVKLF